MTTGNTCGCRKETCLVCVQNERDSLKLQVGELQKERDILKVWGEKADVAAIEAMKECELLKAHINEDQMDLQRVTEELEAANRLIGEMLLLLQRTKSAYCTKACKFHPRNPTEHTEFCREMGDFILTKTEKRVGPQQNAGRQCDCGGAYTCNFCSP